MVVVKEIIVKMILGHEVTIYQESDGGDWGFTVKNIKASCSGFETIEEAMEEAKKQIGEITWNKNLGS